jgi:hypothetical protein
VIHQATCVDTDPVGHPGAFDIEYLAVLEVECFTFGGIPHVDRVADLVGIIGIQQNAVRAEFQCLEGGLGLLGCGDAGQQVCLLADAGDQVFQRDDRPVLADNSGVVGIDGGSLGESLVVLVENTDVGSLWPVVAAAER